MGSQIFEICGGSWPLINFWCFLEKKCHKFQFSVFLGLNKNFLIYVEYFWRIRRVWWIVCGDDIKIRNRTRTQNCLRFWNQNLKIFILGSKKQFLHFFPHFKGSIFFSKLTYLIYSVILKTHVELKRNLLTFFWMKPSNFGDAVLHFLKLLNLTCGFSDFWNLWWLMTAHQLLMLFGKKMP